MSGDLAHLAERIPFIVEAARARIRRLGGNPDDPRKVWNRIERTDADAARFLEGLPGGGPVAVASFMAPDPAPSNRRGRRVDP